MGIAKIAPHLHFDLADLPDLAQRPQDHSSRWLLPCRLPSLERWLRSLLKSGQCVEWGMPPGQNLRHLFLHFMAPYQQRILWVYNSQDRQPYPAGFAAWGANLQNLYFAGSEQPVVDLRAVFLQDLFQWIIIDSPKKMSPADFAFLSAQARLHQQLIFIVRPYLLSAKRGNPYTPLRLNTQLVGSNYQLWGVRGPLTDPLTIPRQECWAVL